MFQMDDVWYEVIEDCSYRTQPYYATGQGLILTLRKGDVVCLVDGEYDYVILLTQIRRCMDCTYTWIPNRKEIHRHCEHKNFTTERQHYRKVCLYKSSARLGYVEAKYLRRITSGYMKEKEEEFYEKRERYYEDCE